MHRDLLAGHKTELNSLTEYVVEQGLKYGVATPFYQKILEKLS
jgi:2-dehydropantoate 2-reductase